MRQRALRLFSALGRALLRMTLRVLLTWLIFVVCLMAALRYMGVPVPGPGELLEQFEGVSRLAEFLS